MTPAEKFEERISPEPMSGCWLWTAGVDEKGYGLFRVNGITHRAHRYAFKAVKGPIPEGYMIDHTCSVRCCVNPDHLEAVTGQENAMRTVRRGRHQHAIKTHCRNGHPYSGGNLVFVGSERRCRVCLRANARAYQQRRKNR